MIPTIKTVIPSQELVSIAIDKDHKLIMADSAISGYCKGYEAVSQAVYKILNSERYKYPIYTYNYGVEVTGLIGQPLSYVCAELPRRITEALLQDERVLDVVDFRFEQAEKGCVAVSFTVHTVYGDITTEKEVSYK